MAITSSTVSGDSPKTATVPGHRRRLVVNLTGDATYATGGSLITAANFGFSKIDHVSAGLNTAGTHLYVWDSANSKLKGYSALGTEIANAADVSAHIIPAVLYGV